MFEMRNQLMLAAGMAAVSGCSAFFMESLQDGWKPRDEPHCETGRGLPWVDSVIAALSLGGAFGCTSTNAGSSCTAGAVADMLSFALSAGVGFSNAGECDAAIRKHNAFVSRQRSRDDREDERREREVDEVRRAQVREDERQKLEIERLRLENERLRREAEDRSDEPPADAGMPADGGL